MLDSTAERSEWEREVRGVVETVMAEQARPAYRSIEEAAKEAQTRDIERGADYWQDRCHSAEREIRNVHETLSRLTNELQDAYAAIRAIRRLHDRGEWQ